MAKKSKKKKADKSRKSGDDVKEAAHKIWLAGLGALALAESEGTKLLKTIETEGSRFFTGLVEKGEAVEKKSKPTVDRLKAKANKARKDASKKTEAGWDKVEQALDDRVTATLHKLGIPTKREIEQLTKRVEELTKKLDGAAKKTTAKKTAAKPRKRTTRKTATKKAAPKPAAGSAESAG